MLIHLPVNVPPSQEAAFRSAMTGNDDDVILAAEKTMQACVDGYLATSPDWVTGDRITIDEPILVDAPGAADGFVTLLERNG